MSVEAPPGFCREPQQHFPEKGDIEAADPVLRKGGFEHQRRPSADIHDDFRHGLIHGNDRMTEALDWTMVGDQLLQALTEHDADILDRVMGVNRQVAAGRDFKAETTVKRRSSE